MTFRQLEYLDALAQCGSITKAAERLFVSQSALSQQIISIEKEHQIQILDRTQKPFTFTETGKTFLKAAQEILEIKRKLEEDLHLRWNNSLYIKTVPFYGMKLVPMLLSKFHYERPEIHVSLESDWAPTLFQSMPRDSVDFFFMPLIWSPLNPLFQRWMGGSTKCCLRRKFWWRHHRLTRLSSVFPRSLMPQGGPPSHCQTWKI